MANILQKIFSLKPKTNLKPSFYSGDTTNLKYQSYFHQDSDEIANKNGGRVYYKRLLQDDEIYSAFSIRKDGTVNAQWEIHSDNQKQATELKEIFSTFYHDAVNYALDSIFFGYSGIELNFDNYFYLKKVPIEAFVPTPEFKMVKNNLSMFWGDGSSGILDEEKYFLTVNNQGVDNVLGDALGSKLYYLYQYKCNILDYYANALRKFGTPYLAALIDDPAFDIGNGVTKAEAVGKGLEKANQGSGIVLGKDEQLIKIESSGGEHFKEALEYFSKSIQKVILGQTLAQDGGAYGSYAQAKIHKEILDARLKADQRLIQPTINAIINQIAIAKGFAPVVFKFVDSEANYGTIERDEKLSTLGVKFNEDYFAEVYGINKNHFSVQQEQAYFNKPFALSKKYTEKDFENDIQKLHDEIAKASPANEFGDEYLNAIKSSKSLEEANEKIKELKPKNQKLYNYVLSSLLINRLIGRGKYETTSNEA